jgi:predicted esterase
VKHKHGEASIVIWPRIARSSVALQPQRLPANTGVPTLVMHGDDDQIVPYADLLAFIKG